MQTKHKRIMIIAIVLLILIMCPIVFYCTRYDFIKRYYFANKEKFNDISDSFKEMYSYGLYRAELDGDNGELELSYRLTDDNNETVYSEEITDCSGKSCLNALNQLREQYNGNNSSAFSYVRADYDDGGNMLLSISVKSKNIIENGEAKIFCYYIVYVDEDYNGSGSDLGIDRFGVSRDTLFAGNWGYWSKTHRLG